jgi:putative flippase GtrA
MLHPLATYASVGVRATLIGYVAGGVVAYLLNRCHTFAIDRWRRFLRASLPQANV